MYKRAVTDLGRPGPLPPTAAAILEGGTVPYLIVALVLLAAACAAFGASALVGPLFLAAAIVALAALVAS